MVNSIEKKMDELWGPADLGDFEGRATRERDKSGFYEEVRKK